jgi:putative RNA 2'-phosphotransferase
MSQDKIRISKFLSLVLRHKPDIIGLNLDNEGWAFVTELIDKSAAAKVFFDSAVLQEIVDTNDKKRFSYNADKTKIRAVQGHSIGVDLNLKPVTPPDILYHGTAKKFWDSIDKIGLEKRSRQYVHLSSDEQTAHKVGIRHGEPLILKIDSKEMILSGHQFFLSENGVWLTDHVPRKFIQNTQIVLNQAPTSNKSFELIKKDFAELTADQRIILTFDYCVICWNKKPCQHCSLG